LLSKELEKKEKARIKQRKLAIQKRNAELEQVQPSDDNDSSDSEEEEEVIEVGRSNNKAGKSAAAAKQPTAKLAPIFMAGKPKVIE
jgi:hypothetical protein